jgi:hypothetical protein
MTVERVGWSPSLEQRLAKRERDQAALKTRIGGLESRLARQSASGAANLAARSG